MFKNIILILLLTSCTASTPYKAYQGEALDEQEISTLRNTTRFDPTSGDEIKIQYIDQKEMPKFQSAFQFLAGRHSIFVCYSEEYKEKTIIDSWNGNYCSIYGTFNFTYNFLKGHNYELSIKPTNKSFAYQNIKVFLIDNTLKTQKEIDIYQPSLTLDCFKQEPNLLNYLVSQCH